MKKISSKNSIKQLLAGCILYIRTSAAALRICFMLKLFTFERLQKIIGKKPGSRNKDSGDTDRIIEAVKKISSLRLFVIRDNCLKRSLLLYYLLKKTGCRNIVLYIGVMKENGVLKGHGWVEYDDRLLLDDAWFVRQYRVIHRIGAE